MRLSKLAASLENVEIVCGEEDWEREIVSLSADSKTAGTSSLFFCLTGKGGDGHTYANEALKRGATAIVVERKLKTPVPQLVVQDSRKAMSVIASAFYDRPSEGLKVIGITGTNGKTTTAHMLASVLEKAGKRVGVIGTLGVRYGCVSLPCGLTTPDPICLQRTLADMRDGGVEYVVMEVSAHALYYNKVAGMRFAACIFTNLTQDHLDFFKDMSEYGEAKSRLFEENVCPLAIVNGDDAFGRTLVRVSKTVVYGLDDRADAYAKVISESLTGSECVLHIRGGTRRVSLKMTGRHNIYNALAAAACATELGLSLRSIAAGLASLSGVNGRLERVGSVYGADVFVDFAHTPDGLKKSLGALKAHCKGRLICLFGCGGNRDKSKRPIMGETVARSVDFAVLTSDNPRYEDPLDILADIEKGYRRLSLQYVVVPKRERAIEYAVNMLKAGDILLVAGKGGESYQEIMGIKYPFKDNDIIEKIIKEKRGDLRV